MNPIIERAAHLMQHKRFDAAIEELNKSLIADPQNPDCFSLLAACFMAQDKFEDAERAIVAGRSIDPNHEGILGQYARLLINQDKYAEAEDVLLQCLQLDPNDADYYGMLSSMKLDQKEFQRALDRAEEGLAVDPENLLCLNLRSTSLHKLGRKEEAYATVDKALENDPDNPFTHANHGWGLLEKGEHKKSLEHFREALKLDPNYRSAKAGMVEALKASNGIYRLWLKYAFWVGNMKENTQWGLMIGMYVCYRGLGYLAQSNPNLAPYVMPILVAYILFALTTWIITPISNLFLRFNKYGRYALTEREVTGSTMVGYCLGIAAFAGLTYLALGYTWLGVMAACSAALMLPVATLYNVQKKRGVMIQRAITIGLLVAGSLGILVAMNGGEFFNLFTAACLVGVALGTWVSNFLVLRD